MKYVKIIGIVLACAFLLACLCGFIVMQKRIPPVEKFYYSLGETFTMGAYEITVTDTKRYDYKTFIDEYNISSVFPDDILSAHNIHTCLVFLTVKNIGSETVTPEIYNINIGTPTISNGLELFTYLAMNNNTSTTLKPTLEPGQSISLTLPYIEYGENHGYPEGEFFSKIDLELTFCVYPEKHVVKLNQKYKE